MVKGSLAGLDRSSLTLELADVRVLVGDIVVSIADGGSRNENGEEAAPSLVWKLFSRALSTTLRAMVEEQAAIAIREAVEEILRRPLADGVAARSDEEEEELRLHQRCLPRRRSQPMQGLVRRQQQGTSRRKPASSSRSRGINRHRRWRRRRRRRLLPWRRAAPTDRAQH